MMAGQRDEQPADAAVIAVGLAVAVAILINDADEAGFSRGNEHVEGNRRHVRVALSVIRFEC